MIESSVVPRTPSANAATSPVALDEGYHWPHADRLLPDRDRLAALFGPPPVWADRRDGDVADTEVATRPGEAPGRHSRAAAAAVPRAIGFTVVAGVLWLVLWATLPRLIGWRPTLIVGGSMAPSIERGDVVLVRPVGQGSLGVGAVVTFPDPNRGGRLVTHRIVALLADGQVQTRGDHNHDPDPQPVRRTAIQGRAVLRIPYVGRPVIWAQDRRWGPLGALAFAVVGVGAVLGRRRAPREGRLGGRQGGLGPAEQILDGSR